MVVEIISLGGYEEVGKNSTAIKIDDEVFILDYGIDLTQIMLLPKGVSWNHLNNNELMKSGIIPNDSVIKKYYKKVKAIIPSHAHLDHLGAIPKISNYPNAKIISTPYTISVLKKLMNEQRQAPKNKLISLKSDKRIQLTENVELELINVTHSTPQSAIIALYTPYGVIIYANDWKLDSNPNIGERTNIQKLKKLGKSGEVLALLSCCLNVELVGRTYSESVVNEMLKDVMFEVENQDNGMILATFSSNVGRIKKIVELSLKLGRKPVIFGSSMLRYISAAEEIGLVNISKKAPLFNKPTQLRTEMARINRDKKSYSLIMTGHQGEEGSVLDRVSRNMLPYKFSSGDQLIFSSRTIPNPTNIANKANLINRISKQKPRIFDNVHVSGHGSREDQRDLINMINPKNFIPCHGSVNMLADSIELGNELGFKLNQTSHILTNGQRLSL